MTDVFELKDSDIAPDIKTTAEKDTPPLVCAEPGCTNEITKPARGRAPKYCLEHRKATNPNRSATSGRTWPRAMEIETILTQYVVGLGMGIQLVNKVDGQVIASGGPAVVHELVELAKTDKNIRKYLEWIATPGKYAPLTMATIAVVLPILANHGMLPTIFTIPSSDGEQQGKE